MRLTVAYDGTAFAGFALQPEQRTVQGVLADAVRRMSGEDVQVRGASRTDAGVHALGQVVAFDTSRDIPPDGWVAGLNASLPDDVAVTEALPCEPGYAPRFDAVDKLYRYVILVAKVRDPFFHTRAWQLKPSLLPPGRRDARRAEDALDLGAMRRAARTFVGTHDFRAFRAADDERQSTVRTLLSVELTPAYAEDPRLLAVEVRGTAFLKQMVRILVGTLVEVGRGRATPASVAALLGPDARRDDAGPTAPAQGLTLVEIRLGRAAGSARA